MADVIAELRLAFAGATHGVWRAHHGWVLTHIFVNGNPIAEFTRADADADVAVAAVNALPALLDVAEAARAFSDAVAACYPAIESAAVFMHVHGQNYTGPTFGAEHEALRAALARLEGK